MKKVVFVFLLLSTAMVMRFVRPAAATGTIYIKSDGSVDPSTAPIQRDGNLYSFTDNISETIEVQRDDIVIDGKGYTLQGPGDYGFYLLNGKGVTVKNTNIMGFFNAIDIFRSSDNTISGNNITDNYNGLHIHFFSSHNIIKDNNIINNTGSGITIYGDANGNIIYHNNFIDNYQQADTEDMLSGTWDNGTQGNYWSDYTGTDANGDGIGDTPYSIHEDNQDRYPLMNTWIPREESPEETPPPEEEGPPPFWTRWWFWTIIAAGTAVSAGAVYFLKKRKSPIQTIPPLPQRASKENARKQAFKRYEASFFM